MPDANEIDRINLADTATEYRDALTPLVSNPACSACECHLSELVRGRGAADNTAGGSHAHRPQPSHALVAGVVHKIGTDERRRRLAIRHHLATTAKATDLTQLACDLVGIHATDPASVYLGALARMKALKHEDMTRALYDDRTVLKVLGMRRTMFVEPRELVPIVHYSVAKALAVAERKRTIQMLEGAGVDADAERWLAKVETETVAALMEAGEATANELTRKVPGLRVQIPFGEGKKWAGKVGVSTRMLFLLATEGRIVRGRPRGTWLSSMYAWAPMEKWLGGPLAEMPVEKAQAELARRYLAAFGPATQRDVQWWTGWTVAATKKALASVQAQEVELDDGTAFVLPKDAAATPDPGTWVALLPTLDTTPMGWVERAWFMGDHTKLLFDRNGNIGPTVWVDGRVVGGWAQTKSGEVVSRLLEDVGWDARRTIDAEAARIQSWLGESRIIPRFRTPLEQELTK